MSSVGSELPKELERVTALRERWRGYAKEMNAGSSFAPGIFLMTRAINGATEALATGDVISMIRAYEDLRGFGDD